MSVKKYRRVLIFLMTSALLLTSFSPGPAAPPLKAVAATPLVPAASPVALHGKLQVSESRLTDCHGNSFQLYGMSTHGIAWFPQYVNRDTFRTLRDDWNTNCIRLALYTAEYNGYCSGGDPKELK